MLSLCELSQSCWDIREDWESCFCEDIVKQPYVEEWYLLLHCTRLGEFATLSL